MAENGQTLSCEQCRWFVPRCVDMGICQQEGSARSLFMIINGENARLMVHRTFSCKMFQLPVDTQKDTL